MPSVTLSQMWFCRIDGAKEYLAEKIKLVANWVDTLQVLAAHHVGDKKENPHCHFVIKLSSNIQKQSFDTRFKKVFTPDKKSSWSTKVWDGAPAACSYLFHEDTADVLVNKGFSDDEIASFKKLNSDTKKVIEVNKERGAKRVVERVLEAMGGDTWDKMKIFATLCDYIREGSMYEPGDFMLKRYVEEIYCRSLSADEYKVYVSDRYYNLFSR